MMIINFLKKWIRYQLSFFFWSYVPLFVVIVFAMVMVTYFPDIAVQATGIFFLAVLVFICWFNYKH